MRKNVFVLFGVLSLFFSCSSSQGELHIHDRHILSYDVIKEFTGPVPALVLIDHRFDDWVGNLLMEGAISAVYWVPEFSVEQSDDKAAAERLGAGPSLHTAEQIRGKIQVMDMRQIEQTKLPENCIASIDLAVLGYEKKAPAAEFLQRILQWLDTQKPRLTTVALSGIYQHSSEDMYSFLTEIVRSLPPGTKILLESKTAMEPERMEELYRWQNWYGPVPPVYSAGQAKVSEGSHPNRSLDPNIRPDPWIWYALPLQCMELLKKKNAVIKGENRKNIVAVWNDPIYKKLQESYDRDRQGEILQSAQQGIFRFWNDAEIPDLPPPGANEGLAIRLLVQGYDRGCLSWYKNSGDLNLFAAYCAAEALRDSRYESVRPDEAEKTLLELTIFGDWEDMAGPEEFIPGYHNLWLADGVYNTILQASLVPQRHYTKEAFLENICIKAGLNKNAWKENKNLQWRRSPGLWYAEPLLLL
jgi:AMMECR1 domain-containing protein